MWDWLAPIALGWDDSLDFGIRQFLADGIGVITFIGQERLNLVGDHAEQRGEALNIVDLPWRQNEAKRTAFGVTPSVEFGAEAAARSAKRFGFLSPLFMPTAQ